MLKWILIGILFPLVSFAKLNVITTTTNLRSLVEEIGGDKVSVISLSKGTQDPHYLEAKPSFAMKVSRGDLLVSVGLGLEDGWLPLIVRGSRNPSLRVGRNGRFVASDFVGLLEVHGSHTHKVSRSEGDVHPDGNPHFMLSPIQSLKVAKALVTRLSSLDNGNKNYFEERLKSFEGRIQKLITKLKRQMKKGIKVVTYHKTLTYFYHFLGISNEDFLEPKPGIPPTASHVIKLIKKIKAKGIQHILVENYFDYTVAERIKKDVPAVSVHKVPVAVDGEKGVPNLIKLYERLGAVFL